MFSVHVFALHSSMRALRRYLLSHSKMCQSQMTEKHELQHQQRKQPENSAGLQQHFCSVLSDLLGLYFVRPWGKFPRHRRINTVPSSLLLSSEWNEPCSSIWLSRQAQTFELPNSGIRRFSPAQCQLSHILSGSRCCYSTQTNLPIDRDMVSLSGIQLGNTDIFQFPNTILHFFISFSRLPKRAREYVELSVESWLVLQLSAV